MAQREYVVNKSIISGTITIFVLEKSLYTFDKLSTKAYIRKFKQCIDNNQYIP